MEKNYKKLTGLDIQYIEGPGPNGISGAFNPVTQQIKLYDVSRYPNLLAGTKAEELLHFFQVQAERRLGQQVPADMIKGMEEDVKIILQNIGFKPVR